MSQWENSLVMSLPFLDNTLKLCHMQWPQRSHSTNDTNWDMVQCQSLITYRGEGRSYRRSYAFKVPSLRNVRFQRRLVHKIYLAFIPSWDMPVEGHSRKPRVYWGCHLGVDSLPQTFSYLFIRAAYQSMVQLFKQPFMMSVVGPILSLNKTAQCWTWTFSAWDKADVTAGHTLTWASGIPAIILIHFSWLSWIGSSVDKM